MDKLSLVDYQNLDSRQREVYNYQKLSALLADYGYETVRLSADWNGADVFALSFDRKKHILIQLKSRLAFNVKYQKKAIYIAFPYKGGWYIFPHDKILKDALKLTKIGKSDSWKNRGGYSTSNVPDKILPQLEKYYYSECKLINQLLKKKATAD
ncbi:MAG TPA: hypothetical protein VMG59_02370 [Phycisphaerae bacterium]|nr:hypothetical protein [Phycisphaerae bacterium]